MGNIRRRSRPNALCGPFADYIRLADSAYTESVESRGRQPFCNGTPSTVFPGQAEHRWVLVSYIGWTAVAEDKDCPYGVVYIASFQKTLSHESSLEKKM